jgi:5-methylcytosine-specific restriction endonuclease McrA
MAGAVLVAKELEREDEHPQAVPAFEPNGLAVKMSSSVRQRRPAIRMDPKSYARLRLEILQRDGSRCQSCGSMTNLDVHHPRRRSDLGNDAEENLITLCRTCHQGAHGQLQATQCETDSETAEPPRS